MRNRRRRRKRSQTPKTPKQPRSGDAQPPQTADQPPKTPGTDQAAEDRKNTEAKFGVIAVISILVLGAAVGAYFYFYRESPEADFDFGPFVQPLNRGMFSSSIENFPGEYPSVVFYYASWCPHCQDVHPVITELSETLAADSLLDELGLEPHVLRDPEFSMPVFSVNCPLNEELCTHSEVTGYPVVKLFRDQTSSPRMYLGPREVEPMLTWAKRKAHEPPVYILSESVTFETLKSVADNLPITVAKNLPPDSRLLQVYTKLGDMNDELAFALDPVVDGFEPAQILIYRIGEYDGEPTVYEIDSTLEDQELIDDMMNAIRFYGLPLVEVLSMDNFGRLRDEDVPLFLYFDYGVGEEAEDGPGRSLGERDLRWSLLQEVAVQIKRKAIVTLVDALMFKVQLKMLIGMNPKKDAFTDDFFPFVMGLDMIDFHKYMFPRGKELNVENLVEFIEGFFDGTTEEHFRSEPVPSERKQKSLTVKKVVGGNFYDLVMESKEDVLLKIYDENCPHCQAFEPVYNQFAEIVKDADIIVAELDGKKNEWPMSIVQAPYFPTVAFFPASDKKNVIVFNAENGRNLQQIVDFVWEHADSCRPALTEIFRQIFEKKIVDELSTLNPEEAMEYLREKIDSGEVQMESGDSDDF